MSAASRRPKRSAFGLTPACPQQPSGRHQRLGGWQARPVGLRGGSPSPITRASQGKLSQTFRLGRRRELAQPAVATARDQVGSGQPLTARGAAGRPLPLSLFEMSWFPDESGSRPARKSPPASLLEREAVGVHRAALS